MARAYNRQGHPAFERRREDILRLRKKGWTWEAIGSLYGVSGATAYGYVRPKKRLPKVLDPREKDEWEGELPPLDDDDKRSIDEYLTSVRGSSMLGKAQRWSDPKHVEHGLLREITKGMKRAGVKPRGREKWSRGEGM